mmetsp:Transcript_21459/g.32438  ORF Transcript_21459/g.32438 Transcript_21459/m.32438 type:complete len:277 (+) Transcript_21459:1318-2148(+)
MIGGFVQQQKFRFQKQRPRQGDPHAPSSGKFFRRHLLHGGCKAESKQNFCRAGFGRVDIERIELVVDEFQLGLNRRLLRLVGRFGHGVVEFFRFRFQFVNFVINFKDGLQGSLVGFFVFAVQIKNIDRVRNRNGAGGNRFQDGRFAAAVGTNEAVPIAVIDDNFRFFDQRTSVKGDGDTTDVDVARIGVQSTLFRFVRDDNVVLVQIFQQLLSFFFFATQIAIVHHGSIIGFLFFFLVVFFFTILLFVRRLSTFAFFGFFLGIALGLGQSLLFFLG